MTIEECMKKICYRSMATPYSTDRWDTTTCVMVEVKAQPRLCVGKACMAFYTYEHKVHKDGGDFKALEHKEEDAVVETHGFCKALFIEVDG